MTMHNHAEVGEISERIVLVGDPNRAKYIAEHYLEDAVLVNDVGVRTAIRECLREYGYL